MNDEIIVKHLSLVKYIAGPIYKRYRTHLEYADIISFGTIGLMEAVERFDDKRGVKFSTFAYQNIRGRILDYILKELYLTADFKLKLKVFSYDHDQTLVQNKRCNKYDPERIFEKKDLEKQLNDILYNSNVLNNQEKEIIQMRYYQEMPTIKIANHFNISRSRVRQVIGSAFKKLRPYFKEEELVEYE